MTEKLRTRRRDFGNSLDERLDKIVYKIMRNEGLEDTIMS
jgi:hypothetical protein